MKTLRANVVQYDETNCVNQHFEILNPFDYGWKVSGGKLKPNWFEESALSCIDIDQKQNNLNTIPDVRESDDNTSSDSEDVNKDVSLSYSNDE